MVLIETVVTGFVDQFPSLGLSKCVRFVTTLSVCVVFFLSGVSMTTQVRRRVTRHIPRAVVQRPNFTGAVSS